MDGSDHLSPGQARRVGAHSNIHLGLRISKWTVLNGWHVFRHPFISALASKGVDQRIIDDVIGYSTEEQRRRYRHLFPMSSSGH
jgi:hypothetical protein